MARVTIRRDSAAIRDLLSSGPVAATVYQLGDQVAGNIRAAQPRAQVDTERHVTDRARVTVVVRDRRARIWQARDGLVTRAASAAGLEVRAWGGQRR